MTAETTIQAIELFVGLVTAAGTRRPGSSTGSRPDPVHASRWSCSASSPGRCSRSTSRSRPRSSCWCCCRGSCSRRRSGSTSTTSGGRSAGSSCSPRRASSSARRSWPRSSLSRPGLPLELGFVVGAMVAATDPVAVVSTFKQLGSPRRLATLIESESLFNDGTAIVVFTVAVQVVVGPRDAGAASSSRSCTIIVASTAIGLVSGWVASRLIAAVDDHLVELTLSVAAAYGTYIVADLLDQSGIIATVVAGLLIGEPRPAGRDEPAVARGARHRLGVRRVPADRRRLPADRAGDRLRRPGVGAAVRSRGASSRSSSAGRSSSTCCSAARRGSRSAGAPPRLPVAWLHVLFWGGPARRRRDRDGAVAAGRLPAARRCSRRSRSGSCCSRCSSRARRSSG